MFKNIVLAVDGSEYSHRALEYARSLTKNYGAARWRVHVFSHTSDLLGYEDFEKLYARRKGAGQAILDGALEKLSGAFEPNLRLSNQFWFQFFTPPTRENAGFRIRYRGSIS